MSLLMDQMLQMAAAVAVDGVPVMKIVCLHISHDTMVEAACNKCKNSGYGQIVIINQWKSRSLSPRGKIRVTAGCADYWVQ